MGDGCRDVTTRAVAVVALGLLAACVTPVPQAEDDAGDYVCVTTAFDLTECSPVEPDVG